MLDQQPAVAQRGPVGLGLVLDRGQVEARSAGVRSEADTGVRLASGRDRLSPSRPADLDALPRRGPGLAGRALRRALPRPRVPGRSRLGLAGPHARVEQPAGRRRMGRHRLAGRARRPRPRAGPPGGAGRGARSGRRARHAQPDRPGQHRAVDHGLRHRRADRTASSRRCCGATRSGARASASPTPAATWPRSPPAAGATATTGSSAARRSGTPTASWPTGASCWCAPIPARRSTAASRASWST